MSSYLPPHLREGPITCKFLSKHDVDWRSAALRIGEDLIQQPPNGYYDLSPVEWIKLAIKSRAEESRIEWHKYPDEKPKNGDRVLFFHRSYLWLGHYDPGENNEDIFCTSNNVFTDDVTHWAEIPEGPK